jgi:hypothetical protein
MSEPNTALPSTTNDCYINYEAIFCPNARVSMTAAQQVSVRQTGKKANVLPDTQQPMSMVL